MPVRSRFRRAWLAATACAALGVVVAPPATAQTPTGAAAITDTEFTVARLDRWLSGGRPRPRVTQLAEATVRYVVENGAADERMLYPTRIAQQLSLSLADWYALCADAQRVHLRFGADFPDVNRVDVEASKIKVMSSFLYQERARTLDTFLQRRAEVFGLVTAAARGDREAAERYAGLAADMAADLFLQEVFRSATVKRSVTADLRATAADAGRDDLARWRAGALADMLEADSDDLAREAFARVEANTVGPVAEDDGRASRRHSGASTADREPRTRTVQDCHWDSGYTYDPETGETVSVEKFVCETKEIEY